MSKLLAILVTFKEVITTIVGVTLAFVLLFSNDDPHINNVRQDIANVSNFLLTPKRAVDDIFHIRKLYEELLQESARLSKENNQLVALKVENAEMRKMLEFKDQKDWQMLPTRVTSFGSSSSVQTITMQGGENFTFHENMPVITLDGLLGKTIVVGETASTVQLITDKNFNVSVHVGIDRQLGIYHSGYGQSGTISGVRNTVDIKIGDFAYTSGISDIYPGEIPVAVVTSVRSDVENPFQVINAEILVDLNRLNYVFVVEK